MRGRWEEVSELINDQLEEDNQLIDLGWCEIGNEGFLLLSARLRPQTTMVNLYRNALTHEVLTDFHKVPLTHLRFLNLSINLIGNAGCKLITRCRWRKLEELQLVRCGIDEYGIAHLAKGRWPSLELLDLSYNSFRGLLRGNWKKMKEFTCNESRSNVYELLRLTLTDWSCVEHLDLGS